MDDVSQLTIKHNETSAVLTALRQGIKLGKGLTSAKLAISDKSLILSNKPKVAARVARQLKLAGFPVQAAQSGNDLGVSTRGGAVRTTSSLAKRCKKAKRRPSRVGTLSRTNVCSLIVYDTRSGGYGR